MMEREIWVIVLLLVALALSGCFQQTVCGNGYCESGEIERCSSDCQPPGKCLTNSDCDDGDDSTTDFCNEANKDCIYGLKTCSQRAGVVCSSEQICSLDYVAASDSKRCCPIACSRIDPGKVVCGVLCDEDSRGSDQKPICKINTEACFCGANPRKNKVAVILRKDGIYDSKEMQQAINKYFSGVKKDLGIDTVGILGFSGASVDELDNFIESLYLENDAKYFILVGEDLPIYNNLETFDSIEQKLEYVGREHSYIEYKGPGSEKLSNPSFISDCKDIAVSSIPGPAGDTATKTEFVKKVFNNFAWLHDNFKDLNTIYTNNVLSIEWDDSLGSSLGVNHNLDFYTLPIQRLTNIMHEEIQERLKEQPAVFVYLVHASLYVTSMGLGSKDDDKINTSIEEYRAFFEKNKIRAPLFVDAFTCGTVPIDWEAPGNKDFCCWPQASLDTGTWAYYSVGGDIHSIGSVINELSEGKTVGDAVLTRPHYQIRTQGDILAHLPES